MVWTNVVVEKIWYHHTCLILCRDSFVFFSIWFFFFFRMDLSLYILIPFRSLVLWLDEQVEEYNGGESMTGGRKF